MKKLLSCLVFFSSVFVCHVAYSQITNYQKIFGGNSFDFGVDLHQLSDTGYLLLGSSSSYSTSKDVILWNLDKDFNYRWHRIFGLNDADNAIQMHFVGVDTFLILNSTLNPGTGDYDIWTFLLLPNGDTLNSKKFNHSTWEFPSCVTNTSDGGYLVAGTTFDTDDALADVFLLKLNSTLQEEWYRVIERSGQDSISSLLEYNGKFYGIGTSENFNDGLTDIRLLKITNTGFLEIDFFYGGVNEDVGSDLALSTDGFLILGGQSKSYGNHPAYFNTFLLKVDTSGAYQWPQPMASNDQHSYYMKRLWIDDDNNIYTFLTRVIGDADFKIFKNDAGGNLLASTSYGTYGDENLGNGIITNDGGIAFFGTTNDFIFGLENFYLVKADSNLVNGINPSLEVGLTTNEDDNSAFDLFPSPVSEKIFVKSKHSILKGKVAIFNSLGIEMNTRISTNGETYQIELFDFPNGIYFARFYSDESNTESVKKFVVLGR
jgi:hypothetical protein